MPDAAQRIVITIVCEGAPDDRPCAEFGLQDRAGAVHGGTRLDDGSIRFEATVQIAVGAHGPRVRGPFVHGASSAPFAYLSCRGSDGGWRFRLKVPLGGILDAVASASMPVALRARIRATGGGSVPLIDGWRGA